MGFNPFNQVFGFNVEKKIQILELKLKVLIPLIRSLVLMRGNPLEDLIGDYEEF